MMADFPALPLWTDAYLADTHPVLTLEEQGCYMLLLMAQWRRHDDRLPDDNKWFCRLLGVHGNKWRCLRKSVLETFFTDDGEGGWYQKRLRKERDFVEKLKRNRSEMGKKGMASRWKNKGLADNQAITPTPTPIKDSESPKRDSSKDKSFDAPNGSGNGVRVDFKKPCYELGEMILGKGYGPLVTDALKTKSPDQVMRLLQSSEKAHNPKAYFTGALIKSVKQRNVDLCRA